MIAKLPELALVLGAIVLPSFLASQKGNNIGMGEVERTAKGVVTAGIILKVYQVYKDKTA